MELDLTAGESAKTARGAERIIPPRWPVFLSNTPGLIFL